MPALASIPRVARTIAHQLRHRLYAVLWRAFSSAKSRLTNLLHQPERFVVRFPSDQEVFSGLAAGHLAMREIVAIFNHASSDKGKEALTRHFRKRTSPRFFVDPDQVAGIASVISHRYPGWQAQALTDTKDWCEKLSQAYLSSLCADGKIDWQNLPKGPGNDHLYQDRIHLFSFATILSRAALYGASTIEDLEKNIASWLRVTESMANPAGYSGCLITVYRAVALTWTQTFLAGNKAERVDLEFNILRILLSDARFLSARLGTSFANNHLLADGFCLWYLGTLFPEFAESEGWKKRGDAVWLSEFNRQVYPDGTSFEHASHYQALVCEMAVAYLLINRRNDLTPPDWLVQRVENMLAFQADLHGAETASLSFGDEVEDPLFPLGNLNDWGHGDLRAVYSALFHSGILLADLEQQRNEASFWLLGGKLPKSGTAVSKTSTLVAYEDGGYFVFKDTETRGRLLFRTGPSPNVPLNPGHMHADFLSIYLHIDSDPIIVEAGTYTYRSNRSNWPEHSPAWRQYFLGPSAHNGLTIEGEDPLARGPGDFPGKPIQSLVVTHAARGGKSLAWVEGENIGDTLYSGCRRGVIQIHGHYWLIYDLLPDTVPYNKASFALQLAISAEVLGEPGARSILVRTGKADLSITLDEGLLLDRVLLGEKDPLGGWVSPRYGEIVAAPMLSFVPRARQNLYATVLAVADEKDTPSRVEAVSLARGGKAFRITHGERVDYLFVSLQEGEHLLEAWSIQFGGKLLWLRTCDGVPESLRWLEGWSVVWPKAGLNVHTERVLDELQIQSSPAGPEVMGCSADQIVVLWHNQPKA